MLLHAREGLQFDAHQPPRHPVLQGHEGQKATGADRSQNSLLQEDAEEDVPQRPTRLLHGSQRRPLRRPDRRQRHRRHLRRPRHHRQRPHLDHQVPRRQPRHPASRLRRARGDREEQRERAPRLGRHQEDAAHLEGDPRNHASGFHPILHLPGSRRGRGVPRVPDSQGMEGAAALQKHPPQPGELLRPRKIRPLQIRGGSKAELLHAIRKRDPFLPWKRTRKAGDARPPPPPHHKIHVVYGAFPKWDTVRTFRAPHQRLAPQIRPQVSASTSSLTANVRTHVHSPCSYPKMGAALPGKGEGVATGLVGDCNSVCFFSYIQ